MIQLGAKDSNMRERRKGVSAGVLKEPAAFKRRVRRFSAAYLSYIVLVIVYHLYTFCSSLHSKLIHSLERIRLLCEYLVFDPNWNVANGDLLSLLEEPLMTC